MAKAIIIDCEHGNISDDSMHNITATVAAMGVSPIVRLRISSPDLVKRALDAGAQYVPKRRSCSEPVVDHLASGIIAPLISSAEEARQLVSHAKFPPQGLRGQGSAFPGFAYGTDIPTYIKTADRNLITCVQIETRAGLENVDSICAVPGVGESSNLRDSLHS